MFHAIISLRIALRAASSPLRNNSAVFLQHRNKCNFWYFVGFTVIFVVIFQSVFSFSAFSLIQIVIGFHFFFCLQLEPILPTVEIEYTIKSR